MNSLLRCPACDSDEIERDYTGRTTRNRKDPNQWSVDRCRRCSHGFMNPQPSWDDLSPYYSAAYPPYKPESGSDGLEDSQLEEQALREGKFRHVPIHPGARLLDVGCGAGMFLRIRKRLGEDVQGVEPSPIGAEQAKAAGLPVFEGTLEDFAIKNPERRFDIITANHVVEHVPRPVETLQTMHGLLAPRGFIWIAVPNADCPHCRSLRDVWHSTDLPLHLMQFTPKSIRAAASRAGLTCRAMTTLSMSGGVAHSVRQLLRKRFLIPLKVSTRVGPINTLIGPRMADGFDKALLGEAIMAEFVPTA
jgi:2-polyprenyl-3-methyl-5-hydroxy-6-metoxy-1,4-benzoquinol methylase